MRKQLNVIGKYLLIGFVAIIPGVMISAVVNRLDLIYAIPLFIFLQYIVGYFTSFIVKKTSDYNLGEMNSLVDVTTNIEVVQGYMQWVKQNEKTFSENELKMHYLHAKKITDILTNLHESNRDSITK
jgi:vacuolar-type H+-ATPase subunit I/STV1